MPKVTRPNITLFTPVKLVPVIVTNIPTEPLVGLKPVIVGVTVKLPELVAAPPDVVMMMLRVFCVVGHTVILRVRVRRQACRHAGVMLSLPAVLPVSNSWRERQ